MATTTFAAGTVITKEWLNDADALIYDIFSGSTTAAGARSALGLGSMATQAAGAVAITGGTVVGITDLAVADGGTGSSTAATAIAALGGLPLAGGTMVGAITMSGASVIDANASIAAHATTMNPWSLGNYVTLTGSAVTFTALANAPQAGAEVELYMNAAHIWTDGAVFEVDGDATWTAEVGDRVLLRAKSTALFTVHPRKKTGASVGTPAASQAQVDAGTASNVYIPPSLRKITLLATQATTSGTTKDFTIPAGARQVKVFFDGFSTSGTSHPMIQLGDAGGIEATSYKAASGIVPGATATAYTTGFGIAAADASALIHGTITLDLIDAATFNWAASGTVGLTSPAAYGLTVGGVKSLSAELTTVRVTTVNGTDTFDAGLVGCSYIL